MNARPSGRLLPHNTEAEESLLGAMLLSARVIADVIGTVDESSFYRPAHGHIFSACLALFGRGAAVDAVTVAEELNRHGLLDMCGGSTALVSLMAGTPTTTNGIHYARIIADHARLRTLIAAGGELVELGYSVPGDIDQAIDQAESTVFAALHKPDARSNTSTIQQALANALDHYEALYERGDAITGVASGFSELDAMLAGFQRGELTVIGARPGMGKTAFGLSVALHAAVKNNVPVLFFSLEMSTQELTNRLVANAASVEGTKFRNGTFTDSDWPKITNAVSRLAAAPLSIHDAAQLTILQLRAEARRVLATQKQLGLIVIDYLQLMSAHTNNETRQLEVSEISRGLKQLARELDVPIIALSQLSRALESRADKRPMLSDLRESGGIEQDSDVVIFIFRDELYHPDSPDKGTAEIIVAKHRAGPVGTCRLAFLGHYIRFAQMAPGF